MVYLCQTLHMGSYSWYSFRSPNMFPLCQLVTLLLLRLHQAPDFTTPIYVCPSWTPAHSLWASCYSQGSRWRLYLISYLYINYQTSTSRISRGCVKPLSGNSGAGQKSPQKNARKQAMSGKCEAFYNQENIGSSHCYHYQILNLNPYCQHLMRHLKKKIPCLLVVTPL